MSLGTFSPPPGMGLATGAGATVEATAPTLIFPPEIKEICLDIQLLKHFDAIKGGNINIGAVASRVAPAPVSNPIPGGGEKVPSDIGSGSAKYVNTVYISLIRIKCNWAPFLHRLE